MLGISKEDYIVYGCPHCGCTNHSQTNITPNMGLTVDCLECGGKFLVSLRKATQIDISPTEVVFIEKHPREGVSGHSYVQPDNYPKCLGEYAAIMNYKKEEVLEVSFDSLKAVDRCMTLLACILRKEPASYIVEDKDHVLCFLENDLDLHMLFASIINKGIITATLLEQCIESRHTY